MDRDKLRKEQIVKSYRRLYCKGCGNITFYYLENYAYHKKNDIFMTVEVCVKCGLIAYSNNIAGWTDKKTIEKEMIKEYIDLTNLKTPLR